MACSLLRPVACLTLAAVAAVAAVPSQAAQATLQLTARVLKHARLQLLSHPSSIVVTPDDVNRGYVEVGAPTELAIRSNSPDGYALEFASNADFVRQVSVVGLGSDVQLGPAGGVVTRPAASRGMATTTIRLAFRFTLAESAQPGTYPWPMQLSIEPL